MLLLFLNIHSVPINMMFASSIGSNGPRIAMAVFVLIMLLHILMLFNNRQEGQSPDLPTVRTQQPQIQVLTSIDRMERKPFPRKIWQTSKSGISGMDDSDREAIRTWTKMNQKWRYESVTQYSAESYIRETFPDRPDILEVFTDLQDPILRADMIRYLLLLGDGGLYTDLDTEALKPIEDWIPAEYRTRTNVVIGVEYDRLNGLRWLDWSLDLQFASWAILAKPNHPLLELTVYNTIKSVRSLAFKQDTTIGGIKASQHEVLNATGPAQFTQSVFQYLSHSTGTDFTWMNVTDLKVPILVEDVLILPITAFGCGQPHSNSGEPDDETALVHHLFKGSWKFDRPM